MAGVLKGARDPLVVIDEMLLAIAQVEAWVAGQTREAVEANVERRAAIERFVEIISEASRHLSQDVRQLRADIPWRAVGDVGNVLRHGYFQVRFDRVWEIATLDLPALRLALEDMRRLLSQAP
jgi:uncharacterized protein with HEPN domain